MVPQKKGPKQGLCSNIGDCIERDVEDSGDLLFVMAFADGPFQSRDFSKHAKKIFQHDWHLFDFRSETRCLTRG